MSTDEARDSSAGTAEGPILTAFQCAHASAPDWESAARSCLTQLTSVPAGCNLGFLYVSDSFAPNATQLLEFLRVRTGVAHWVGSVGLGVCSAGVEYFERPAIAMLVGQFPEHSFRVFSTIVSSFEGFEAEHRKWCEQAEPYFGVVHADPRNAGIADLVTRLTERMHHGFLVGGLASSRREYVQLADGITEGGLSGVLFSSSVAVTTRLTQGCSPIGARRQITACEGNLIKELDARPALDVFYDDIGEVLARNPAQVAGYIFAALPVRGSDNGDYLVRNLVGIDPQNKILAIGQRVAVGDQLMFCRRDAETAAEDMLRMLREIKRSLKGTPRGGVRVLHMPRPRPEPLRRELRRGEDDPGRARGLPAGGILRQR